MKGHSERVASVVRMLGAKSGVPEKDLPLLAHGGFLHDIGKISVSMEILCKPTRLTAQEFEIMKEHSALGGELVRTFEFLSKVAPTITHHHERWDGRGYPDGLSGERIPLWARFLCLADAFEVTCMKMSRTASNVKRNLENGSGSQFDPALVSILLDHMSEAENLLMNPDYHLNQ